MSALLPPAKDYRVEIDGRFLISGELIDEDFRVYVLLEHFFAKRDGRSKAQIGAASVAAILGRDVHDCLDRLQRLGVIKKFADEDWSSIGVMTTGGREIAAALGFEVGPPPIVKLDTRLFFCPDVSDRAARIWAAASAKSLAEVAVAQGWTMSDQKEAADELAAVGLATYSVSKDGIDIVAKKMPKDGLHIVEFTSEELGKVRGSRPVLIATDDRRQDEKQRRDRSRGLR